MDVCVWQVAFGVLKRYDTALLLADFNFGDGHENVNLDSNFVDVWPTLRPHEGGFTSNYRENFLTKARRNYEVSLKTLNTQTSSLNRNVCMFIILYIIICY